MISDLQHADSRALHEPFVRCLVENGPHATFKWLTNVLATQSPSLRSSNSMLVAYTGCLEGIDWREDNVASPVTEHWGNGAEQRQSGEYDSQGQALSGEKRVAPGQRVNNREALKERNTSVDIPHFQCPQLNALL